MSRIKWLFALVGLIVACQSGPDLYTPSGLKRLGPNETIQRFKQGQFIGEQTVIKDSLGNELDYQTFAQMNDNRFFADQYINAKGEVIELVVRGFRPSDQPLIDSLAKLMQERNNRLSPVPVDCATVRDTLQWVYERDQGIRDGKLPFDARIDRLNQEIVASIIDKCGFPQRAVFGDTALAAIFLVVQHGEAPLRAQLYPVIVAAMQQGEYAASQIALMEDRIRMDQGLPQKYGSQIIKEPTTGAWAVYPIEEPERVDFYRDSVGLEGLATYLNRFGLLPPK
ncbi:MAG: DUF6624 domain-containing protein [Bacteroidota bacterium]